MIKELGNPIVYDKYGKPIRAKTHGQLKLIEAIDKYDILFVNGPAGCGKTFLSICKAIAYLRENKFEKLIVTRPAVESGENLGFLPGSLDEKIAPYMKPIFDSINKLVKSSSEIGSGNGNGNGNNGNGKKKTKKEKEKEPEEDFYKRIEIFPLAYMRGSTLDNAFVISDESQNMDKSQMQMFLTRIGANCKVVITGDASQSDLDRSRTKSGFKHAQDILKDIKQIGFITLTEDDIVRHKVIKQIIMCYQKDNYSQHVQSNKDPY